MSDFTVDIDTSSITRANTALQEYGDSWAKMVNRVVTENNRMAAAVKASEKSSQVSIEAQKRLALATEKANSDEVFKGIRRKITLMEASAKVEARLARESEVAANKVITATKRQSAELERLKLKYSPLYASSKQFERAQEEIEAAFQLGAIGAKQYSQQLALLQKEYSDFNSGAAGVTNRFVTGVGGATKSMNGMNMVVQQAGYQIGDFAVQVQSGQSALVAFSQQATQLVGVLPMVASQLGLSMKAAIGLSAGLGIGIPVVTSLGGLMWTIFTNTDKSKDSAKDFEEALQAARDASKDMADNIDRIKKGLKDSSEDVLFNNLEAAKKSLEGAQAFADNPRGDRAGASKGRLADAQALVDAAQEELDLFRQRRSEEATLQETTTRSLNDKLRLLEIEKVLGKESLTYKNQADEYERQALKLKLESENVDKQVITNAIATLTQIQKITRELEDSKRSVLVIANADMASGIGAAAAVAEGLASSMRAAAAAVAQIVATGAKKDKTQLGFGFGDVKVPGVGGSSLGFGDLGYLDDSYRNITDLREEDKKKSRGSSGGASKANLSFIENMRTEMAHRRTLLGLYGEERDLAEEVYRINQSLGESKNKYSALAISNLAKENLALQAQEELYQKSVQNMQAFYDNVESSFSEAFTSIINGTESVEDAFKKMAKSIIDQLLQVIIQQKIVGSFSASTGKGSGIMGAIFGGIFGREQGGPVNANQPYVVGEKEPELFVPRTSGTIYNQKQLSQMNSGGSGGGTMELIVRSEDGVTIDVVRNETNMQIRKAAPGIVNASVNASQKSLRNGPKSSWGL